MECGLVRIFVQSKSITEDGIVGELGFGFWTGLTNRPYEQVWPKFIKQAFPNAMSYNRTRTEIAARANKLRVLRNSIFHHHSIWHWADLVQHHNTGFELINWIEPELGKLVKATDRFPQVHSNGRKPFEVLISN
jgi:hypothetical protein